MFGLMDIGSVW